MEQLSVCLLYTSYLERHCKGANIPIVSIHGLRHTHASLLLFAGVSIASVARRLGHSSMTTTQKTYLHIINELENKDIDIVMRSLSKMCIRDRDKNSFRFRNSPRRWHISC